jgi:ATP-dependent helicase HrpA
MPEEAQSSAKTAQRGQACLADLRDALTACTIADRARLGERCAKLLKRCKRGQPVDKGLPRLEEQVRQAIERAQRRKASVPSISYPPELPIVDSRDEIAAALKSEPVVIVAGQTGSGKTTQLPKIALEAGRGVSGAVACTQPRRIAATSVADRVASELQTPLGEQIGYQIRFENRTSPETLVKFMTDGVLLAEIQSDPDLRAYDTIIVDEAHERSLNIDFLLGHLKKLIRRRPDLRIIVSSATLDVERFEEYFNEPPVIEVEGRTYPVEVQYQPPEDGVDDGTGPPLSTQVAEAVQRVTAEDSDGDVLVFLPTEAEIREASDEIEKQRMAKTEVVPLFGRLSASEQARVFRPGGLRRIVLATNVAETSVTVPRIRYVIDSGLARLRRFNHHTQVEHLQVEPVSQASAEQRKGRCGRLGPGICIRLYSEKDYQSRPSYTPPEILRSSLAGVILQMESAHLGKVEDFPFLEPPSPVAIKRGYAELREVRAVDEKRRLTETGKRLARLPLEPQYARMLLDASDRGCLREALIIVSALSIRDPRERPLEKRDAADAAHAEYLDEDSDFLSLVRLWNHLEKTRRSLPSNNQFRKWCKDHFINYVRVREWRQIRDQLADELKRAGCQPNRKPADPDDLHHALLTGLLSRVGNLDERREYRGAHGTRFRLFPGSGLYSRSPKWVMAAEVVETSRLYARTVAAIRPEWIERAASHLVRRSHSDPHWDAGTGYVRAWEQVSLYGLPVVERRRVHYGPIRPAEARSIFIRHGLVEGQMPKRFAFLEHNQELVLEVEMMEHKARSRDLLADKDALAAFYDRHLPKGIHSVKQLERWLHKAEQRDPQVLRMRMEDVQLRNARGLSPDRFPDVLEIPEGRFPLEYRFQPGDEADGITCRLPAGVLGAVEDWRFEWLVPGFLPEKVALAMRALPKRYRKQLVPIPDSVDAVVAVLVHGDEPLPDALAEAVREARGVLIPVEAWREALTDLASFVTMRFETVDTEGRVLKSGRDLQGLREALVGHAKSTFERASKKRWEKSGVTEWTFGDLPERVQLGSSGAACYGYPALVDRGKNVAIELFPSPEAAVEPHRQGTMRLYTLAFSRQLKEMRKSFRLPLEAERAYRALGGDPDALCEEAVESCLDFVLLSDHPPIRDEATFRRLAEGRRGPLAMAVNQLGKGLGGALPELLAVRHLLREHTPPLPKDIHSEIGEHLRWLIYPGFLKETPPDAVEGFPRILAAVRTRLEKVCGAASKDRKRLAELTPYWDRYREEYAAWQSAGRRLPRELIAFRWLLEEFRISLFAQEVGAACRVSAKRLDALWNEVPPAP